MGGGGQQTGRVRTPSSVRGDGASTQTAACQALEDVHRDVHERAEIEEQVVEGVDRQATGLICVL